MMTKKSKFPPVTREGLSITVDGLNREFSGIATFLLEEKVFDGEPSFVVATVLQGDSVDVWLALANLKTLYRNVGYSVCRGDAPVGA